MEIEYLLKTSGNVGYCISLHFSENKSLIAFRSQSHGKSIIYPFRKSYNF